MTDKAAGPVLWATDFDFRSLEPRVRLNVAWVSDPRDPWGYAEPSVKRVHRRLFKLNERIATLEEELESTKAELEYHRSINDDAQRDAAIGNYIDREEAGATAADVQRFERTIIGLESKREKLVYKRDRLMLKLPS